MPTVNLTPEERTREFRLGVAAGSFVRQAANALAMAAACEERITDTNGEHQLYFLARTICVEHGLDYLAIVKASRDFARAY